MITDKQGREWLLQRLYDDGWRCLVMDKYENVYLTNEKPSMFNDTGEVIISSCEKALGITAIKTIFSELKPNEYISIEKELGIVDWSKVEVDTPILVKHRVEETWEKRHFACFKNGYVYTWREGTTSWSVPDEQLITMWNYAKLAEV